MKLPRIECEDCGRAIAAGPVAGRPSKGRLWRHDAPTLRREVSGSLVSCPGSLAIVDLPVAARQLEIDIAGPGNGTDPEFDDSPALF